jgi:hypothetical protein
MKNIKTKKGFQEIWNLEKIREAVIRFKNEHRRNPRSGDFVTCEYLPSARQIERRFGGMEKLRKDLNLEGPFNFTKGEHRSNVAKQIITKSYKIEEEFYNYLLTIYPAINIHEQKRLRPGNVASDFFIYTSKDDDYAIDVFQAQDLYTLRGTINIKVKRYRLISNFNVYFVVIGDFRQEDIDEQMSKKKIDWPDNIYVLSLAEFKSNITDLE